MLHALRFGNPFSLSHFPTPPAGAPGGMAIAVDRHVSANRPSPTLRHRADLVERLPDSSLITHDSSLSGRVAWRSLLIAMFPPTVHRRRCDTVPISLHAYPTHHS